MADGKCSIESGRSENQLKSSAVGKFKEALDVFPDTLSVPLCLPRKELHGLPKVLSLTPRIKYSDEFGRLHKCW